MSLKEISIPIVIVAACCTIYGFCHNFLLDTLSILFLSLVLAIIMLLILCLIISLTYIFSLHKKLNENKPDSETLDIAPVLKAANERMQQVNILNPDNYSFIKDPGYYTHKVDGGEFCHPCLISSPPVISPLTEPNEGEWLCNKCNTTVYTKEPTHKLGSHKICILFIVH